MRHPRIGCSTKNSQSSGGTDIVCQQDPGRREIEAPEAAGDFCLEARRLVATGPPWHTDFVPTALETLSVRLAEVRARIERACGRARRDPSGIMLLAVTKVFPAAIIHEAYAAGLREFGENYVQEFEGKAPSVAGLQGARFHLIGHLQSNKSRKAAELFDAVQTVDSARLAVRLNEAAAERGKMLDAMLEVKVSHEEAKSGASPEELPELIAAVRECPMLRLLGLMTMPPWSDDAEASRPYFRELRELAERHGLEQLSIGMSHDLETAIEEGSTCVRVGTALFGRRIKN
jgi:PLP dependent protein